MRYKICEYCGSNLDFGETCDCRKEEQKNDKETVEEGEDYETVTTATEAYAPAKDCYYGSRPQMEELAG